MAMYHQMKRSSEPASENSSDAAESMSATSMVRRVKLPRENAAARVSALVGASSPRYFVSRYTPDGTLNTDKLGVVLGASAM